jgi:hypothetical protein
MLLSFWLLTFVIVGAALLRAAFTGKVEAFREPNKDFRKTEIRDLSIWPSSIRRVSRARI